MLEKLKQVRERYDNISLEISDPEIISNAEKYKNLMREHKGLTPVVEKYVEYLKCESDMNGALELSEDKEADAERRELASEEEYD